MESLSGDKRAEMKAQEMCVQAPTDPPYPPN
jgi:hypothetical protein